MDIKVIFGNNIRTYRKKLNMTQGEFAEKIDVTVKHLGLIERGGTFVTADLLQKIADVLQVSVATLFYCENESAGSESFLGKIDSVIEKELLCAIQNIKTEIRK